MLTIGHCSTIVAAGSQLKQDAKHLVPGLKQDRRRSGPELRPAPCSLLPQLRPGSVQRQRRQQQPGDRAAPLGHLTGSSLPASARRQTCRSRTLKDTHDPVVSGCFFFHSFVCFFFFLHFSGGASVLPGKARAGKQPRRITLAPPASP